MTREMGFMHFFFEKPPVAFHRHGWPKCLLNTPLETVSSSAMLGLEGALLTTTAS